MGRGKIEAEFLVVGQTCSFDIRYSMFEGDLEKEQQLKLNEWEGGKNRGRVLGIRPSMQSCILTYSIVKSEVLVAQSSQVMGP